MVNSNEIKCFIPGPSTVTNTNNHGNSDFNNRQDNIPLLNNDEIKYFLLGPSKESGIKASTERTKQLQKVFEDVFSGIWCFDGMFSLQIKPDS